jgi:hypothetical protein
MANMIHPSTCYIVHDKSKRVVGLDPYNFFHHEPIKIHSQSMFTSKILCLASLWYFLTPKSNVCSFLCLLHCCFLNITTILKHPTQLLTSHYQIHTANFLQHWSNIFPQTTKMKTIAWSWSLRALKLPKSTIKHDLILNFNSFTWAPNTNSSLSTRNHSHLVHHNPFFIWDCRQQQIMKIIFNRENRKTI